MAMVVLISGLMFLPSYTLHFDQFTVDFYKNGQIGFTTDAAGLVRSMGAVAMMALVFGVVLGAAIGLTRNVQSRTNPALELGPYEDALAITGLVKITKTNDSKTYQLTDHGRRFLREYRFLDKAEYSVPSRSEEQLATPTQKT